MLRVRTVSAAAGMPSASSGHQPKASPACIATRRAISGRIVVTICPRGDVRQRVLEARQDFAQAASIRYRYPIVAPIGPWFRSIRADETHHQKCRRAPLACRSITIWEGSSRGPLWLKRPRGRLAANGFVHGSKNERERCCVIEVRIDAELMHFERLARTSA
jgi:hypothetical protein